MLKYYQCYTKQIFSALYCIFPTGHILAKKQETIMQSTFKNLSKDRITTQLEQLVFDISFEYLYVSLGVSPIAS